ncbi:hypothetical protein FACS1894208_09140 [Clostridia bacterium]|nr:hypothetical protein FACS1894208_09140 [Clostridia bacterium]
MLTAQIQKWGGANAVRLPKAVLNLAEIDENSKVEFVVADVGSILIRRVDGNPPRLTLNDLFADHHGDYRGETIDWGDPIGEEVW